MVDIHSHVLYGLDDGPKTLDESVAMIRMAAGAGTTDIVASPHADLRYTYQMDTVEQRIAELAEATGGMVRIHRGCDFHLYYENVHRAFERPQEYTIDGKRYLLVEFSDLLILSSATEIFERLLAAGITPIITHPERNRLLARAMDQISGWVQAGCRIQITAESYLGRFGRRAQKAAHEFTRARLAHFVASDAHDMVHRTPVLTQAFAHVAERYGKSVAMTLFEENPKSVLSGDLVDTLGPETSARQKWWQWWSR